MRQIGERGHEGGRAGDRYDAVQGGGLLGEHPAVVGVVQLHGAVGEERGHGRVALAAVHDLHHLDRVEPLLRGPPVPAAFDDGVGVDDGAVHVQEQGLDPVELL